MTFLRRLGLYGFGFVMGLMIVLAMFGTRSCVMPAEIKLMELQQQTFRLSDLAKCKMRCLRKNEMLMKLELKQFEINYDVSNIHKEPCGEYYLQPAEKYKSSYNYKVLIRDCDTISRIDDIQITSGPDCNCRE
jgi:hypothetical protein